MGTRRWQSNQKENFRKVSQTISSRTWWIPTLVSRDSRFVSLKAAGWPTTTLSSTSGAACSRPRAAFRPSTRRPTATWSPLTRTLRSLKIHQLTVCRKHSKWWRMKMMTSWSRIRPTTSSATSRSENAWPSNTTGSTIPTTTVYSVEKHMRHRIGMCNSQAKTQTKPLELTRLWSRSWGIDWQQSKIQTIILVTLSSKSLQPLL